MNRIFFFPGLLALIFQGEQLRAHEVAECDSNIKIDVLMNVQIKGADLKGPEVEKIRIRPYYNGYSSVFSNDFKPKNTTTFIYIDDVYPRTLVKLLREGLRIQYKATKKFTKDGSNKLVPLKQGNDFKKYTRCKLNKKQYKKLAGKFPKELTLNIVPQTQQSWCTIEVTKTQCPKAK